MLGQPNMWWYIPFLILPLYLLITFTKRARTRLPPGPFPSLPLIGHLYLLKKPLHQTLTKLSRTYGPVMYLRFGSRPVVVVSTPEAAEQCLGGKNDVVFANRPIFVGGQIMSYNNTILAWAPYGDHWRNLRRISTAEILSANRIALLSEIRHDEVRSLVRSLLQATGSGRVNGPAVVKPRHLMFEMIYNIMMRMLVGDESSKGQNGKKFKEVMDELFLVGGTGGMSYIGDYIPLVRKLGFKGLEKTFLGIHEKSDRFLQGLVDEYRSKMDELDSDSGSGLDSRPVPMIHVLLTQQRTRPEYYTDKIIKGLIFIMLIGGIETSEITLEWALSLLLNHQEVLHKAQAEIDNNVGNDHLLNESDLTRLHYLYKIINETFRMHPVGPLLLPHQSSDDCVVEGYHVPKGTMLLINVSAIHNDPRVWDEPEKFKPERFESTEGGSAKIGLGYKLMPFGSGRRSCPGENLGLRFLGLTLGSLIQCFDWERESEILLDMEEGAGHAMPRATPLRAKITPRPSMMNVLSQI